MRLCPRVLSQYHHPLAQDCGVDLDGWAQGSWKDHDPIQAEAWRHGDGHRNDRFHRGIVEYMDSNFALLAVGS